MRQNATATAVVVDFTKMDQYCDYAQANKLKMRGHTFVWHSQTPSWFFREGFDANGAYVDVATMDIRLEQFMDQVFGHIQEKYPNLFYAYAAGNIDAIGMQSHVNIEFPSMEQYRATIKKFVDAGYNVEITELDIATAINGNGPVPTEAMAAKQAQIYKELFQCYIDYKDNISSVTLWGINDQHSWRGSQDPLIYDREYNEKDSYWNIISVGLPGE